MPTEGVEYNLMRNKELETGVVDRRPQDNALELKISVPLQHRPKDERPEDIPPLAGGSPWLYERPEDIAGLPEELRIEIETLELASPWSRDLLREHYHSIFDMVRRRVVPAGQAGPFLRKIERRIDEAERMLGRAIPRIPERVEDQRELIIPLLERIEATDYPLSQANVHLATDIEASFSRMDRELAEECRARIRLHDSFAFVSAISGDTEQAVKDLRTASNELSARGHILEGEDFEVLLKKGIPGLRVAEAFKKLEDWAVNGRGRTEESVRYRQEHSSQTEQNRIVEDIIGELGGDVAARTSFKLAVRIAVATFETSVWNRDLQGKDVLGEAIYLKDYREGRARSGRDRGPEITVPYIKGFGTSFFRNARTANGRDLRPRLTIPEIEISNQYDREIEQTLSNLRIEEDKKTPPNLRIEKRKTTMDFERMNFMELTPGSYGAYLGIDLPRVLNTKLLLLKTDFKPDDFTRDQVHSWVAPFSTADHKGLLRLRSWFVLGALDEGLRQGERLGWGQLEISQAVRILTDQMGQKKGKDDKESPVFFITHDQMEWILGNLRAGRRGFFNDWLLALRGTIRVRR